MLRFISARGNERGSSGNYFGCMCLNGPHDKPCRANLIEKGLFRELDPGPLAPEARIIPLDQTADCAYGTLHIIQEGRTSRMGMPWCLGGGSQSGSENTPTVGPELAATRSMSLQLTGRAVRAVRISHALAILGSQFRC